MRQIVIALFILLLSVPLLTGCQESQAGQIRRARVIADENLELKQELKQKNKQIQDLNKQIEEIEAKNAEEHKKFGETTLKTLKILAESENKNKALTAENKKLKEELEKLKAQ
ncbi:MAG: hypothetical protein ACYTCN_09105 [Planctomycetota bacterium]|jgi:uncharacterized protein YlxW (UPF0749 family)